MTKSEGNPNDKAREANSPLAELFGRVEIKLDSSRAFPPASFGLWRLIALVGSLSVSLFAASAPSTDPADSAVWPNQDSHANGDRWMIEHHGQIRRMNPRLLVLNFDNHAPRERLERLVDKIIAGIAEGSRYHGYNDSNAPVFLQYQVFKFVDLRDTNATKSGLNSRLFPLKPGVTNTFNVDHNRFFSHEFARYYGVANPQEGESFLRLDELVDLGYVHEVWLITNGDESRIKAFECVELKPRYNERFERVGDDYVQAGNGGDPDQKWTGRSLRLGFVNSTRGSGCFLESLSHSVEGISTSGAIPYFTRYFAEFAGYDLDTRWNLPFNSLYALAYEGRVVEFPDNHTAVIKAPNGDSIVVSNYFAIGGNAHWPPNARGHYDMDNTNAVLSTIEDWRIGSGPDGTDVKKPWTNAAFAKHRALAPDCMGAWLVYWRQNFPGLDNKQKDDHGNPMKNWWPFLFY